MKSNNNPSDDKKQDKDSKSLVVSSPIRNLPSSLVDNILSFNNRKDFQNFTNTCLFFKIKAKNSIYNKLAAPSIDFKAFAEDYPKDNQKILLQHKACVSSVIQLSNGNLVSGTYSGQIYVWQVPTGKLLAEIETEHGQIDQLIEVKPNIIAIGHHNGFIKFLDCNSAKPVTLAIKKLPENNEHVCAFSLCAPGKLAFVSFIFNMWNNSYFRLKILDFDPTSIKDPLHISTIATVDSLSHNGQLFSLDKERLLVATTHGMCVYDTESKDVPLKSITFPPEKQFPYVIKLKNNKILTGFITRKDPKEFVLDIWDLSSANGSEHYKTISLPLGRGTRGIYHISQRINGELLIIPDDLYEERILVVDVERENGKELLETFNSKLSSLNHSEFIEDGRYLLTSSGSITCIRFPLIKNKADLSNDPVQFKIK